MLKQCLSMLVISRVLSYQRNAVVLLGELRFMSAVRFASVIKGFRQKLTTLR